MGCGHHPHAFSAFAEAWHVTSDLEVDCAVSAMSCGTMPLSLALAAPAMRPYWAELEKTVCQPMGCTRVWLVFFMFVPIVGPPWL